MHESVTVVGSGIDALVCSASLLHRGVTPRLLVETDRLGGHFAGWSPGCGSLVDLGMVALEDDVRDTKQLPLAHYNGEAGVTLRPFLGEVFARLRQLGWQFQELQTGVYTSDQIVPDYFISDRLDYLRDPKNQLRITRVRAELTDGLKFESLIRNKNRAGMLLKDIPLLPLLERSLGLELASHLFGGLIAELDPDGKVQAIDHRLIWLPLYWPSTLLQILEDGEGLPANRFLTTIEGSVAASVAGLASSLREAEVIEMLVDGHLGPPRSRSVARDDMSTSSMLIDFREPRRQGSSTILRVVHFCAAVTRSETFFLRSPINGAFRVNLRTGAPLGSVSVEFGSSATSFSDEEIVRSARVLIERFGVIPGCDGATVTGRVSLSGRSTPGKLEDYVPLCSQFGQNGATNFNEAVTRGLAVADLLYQRMS
jgi:hypothetical protein